MSILEDTILSFIYVASGTVYTITPEIARGINATGVPDYKEHTFEHPFLLMAFEFLAQAFCYVVWWILFQRAGGRPGENGGGHEADDEPLLQAQHPDIQNDPRAHDGDVMPLWAEDNQGEGQEDVNFENYDYNADDDGDHLQVPNNPAWNRPVDPTKFNRFLFLVPAVFDLCRYGLLYIGIKLAYRSSHMLTRSAAVLFTVLLRVAFLSKYMAKYTWVAISAVFVGLGLIGMTDFVHHTPPGYDRYGLAAGCLLMTTSEILIAMQIVFEEKFMDKHSIHPLRVVGLEGLFGSFVAFAVLGPFSIISAGPFSVLPDGHLVNVKDAFLQMSGSWPLALCVVGRVISKPALYYTGNRFVLNQHDAAKRITIDVQHSLIIWSVSLAVGWQQFFYPQIFGYILVLVGMLVYCDIIPLPQVCRPTQPVGQQDAYPLQEGDGAGDDIQGEEIH